MSFMDFTMYPNGGFMMCESISEFDPNTPNTPGEEAIAAAPIPTVRDAIANLDDNICIQHGNVGDAHDNGAAYRLHAVDGNGRRRTQDAGRQS